MERLEKYALKENIPIMQKDGIEFLVRYIEKNNIKSILEIGTAIGYSAIKMAKLSSDINIVTIERDYNRYDLALKNINDYNVDKQIKVIYGDALNIDIKDKFDLIFIDAAKAQYIKFFNKYKDNLKDNGVIVSDNLNFHGLVKEDVSKMSRNVRGLVTKINRYVDFLKENGEFITEFHDIGDGVSISIKKCQS